MCCAGGVFVLLKRCFHLCRLSQLLLIELPDLSLTMLMLVFTTAEVTRVRNSRNMVAWSLLLAAFCIGFRLSYYSVCARVVG